MIFILFINAKFLTYIRLADSLLLRYGFYAPELLKDLNIRRIEPFLVILGPLDEFKISFLNKTFKFAEDAAAERHIAFSKLMSNQVAIRIPASFSYFS